MSNVTISENGLYEVTYTATDESGNSSSVVRTVTVSSLASDPVDSTSSCGVEQPDAIIACTQDATAPTVLNCPAEPGSNPLETVCIPCGSRIYGCTNRAALNYNIRATHDDGSCVFLQPPELSYGGTSLLLPQCGRIFRFSPSLTGGPVVGYEICNSTANPPLPSPPSWINLDPKTGQLFGVSPCGQGLNCDFEPFQIRVCAINDAGVGSVTITINPFCPVVVPGCTNPKAVNFNPDANQDDGSCQIVGCRDPQAPNFDPEANIDGFCVKLGCTTPGALNWNPLANTDDGSCVFCQDPYVQITSIEWVEPYYSSGLPPWFTPNPALDERCYQCYLPLEEQGHCEALTPCLGPRGETDLSTVDWTGIGDLVISGLARNTTQVLVTINGITKTVLVSSTGNWVAIFSRAEVLQFPYGTLEVQATSSSFCDGGGPGRDSRQFENPEPIEVLPYCPDRRIVIQVCNANSIVDDNFNVYLNGTYIGFLNLGFNAQVGSVFIFDPSATIAQPDFSCPLTLMTTYRVDPKLLKSSNTLVMQNVKINYAANYGTVQIRNYLRTASNTLVSPCAVANLEYEGPDGASFSFSFPYTECCQGDVP